MAKRTDDNWPMRQDVLLSLSEDVRPVTAALPDDERVVANVRSCLAERVVLRCTGGRRSTVAAARHLQIRLMAVRSAYRDGAYYRPDAGGAPYAMQTVEELRLTDGWLATVNANTYVIGTVQYENGVCHLRGLAEPAAGRVPVDCSALTNELPRDRATVKAFCVLTVDDRQQPVLVLHHFHEFSAAALFR